MWYGYMFRVDVAVEKHQNQRQYFWGRKALFGFHITVYCLHHWKKPGQDGRARMEPGSKSSCRKRGKVLITGSPFCCLSLLSSTSCRLICLLVDLVETFLSSCYLQSDDNSFYKLAIKLSSTISASKHIQLYYKVNFWSGSLKQLIDMENWGTVS